MLENLARKSSLEESRAVLDMCPRGLVGVGTVVAGRARSAQTQLQSRAPQHQLCGANIRGEST